MTPGEISFIFFGGENPNFAFCFRVKREAPAGFFWPEEGGSMGRQQRNDLLSHALRIKKNAG